MFKLRINQNPSVTPVAANKPEHAIHRKALIALEHYYKHGDSTLLTRIVRSFPNSNRRVAMLEWIRKFSVLRWDRESAVLMRAKLPEQQDMEGATVNPFWTFKVKQEQRRHVSGNTFDPDHFFDRVVSDIKANIEMISPLKLESTAVLLIKLASDIKARRAHDGQPPA